MSDRLKGKIAIVTGGASGIGARSAEIMAQEKATVMIADKNVDGANEVAERICQTGGRAAATALDLADPQSIRTMIDQTVGKWGGFDVLFNNAADTKLSSTKDCDIEHMDIEIWDRLLQINLRGTMLCTKYAIPHLRVRGGGSIINTASGAGLKGADGGAAYGVGKAGVIIMTKYVATVHGKENIRCNAICPGLILTPALDPENFGSQAFMDAILDNMLTPRLGEPSDIAWAAVWLASDESQFVTGQCIQVDGGQLEHQPYWSEFRRFAPSS